MTTHLSRRQAAAGLIACLAMPSVAAAQAVQLGGTFNRDELRDFWRIIRACRSSGEAAKAVDAQFGRFPMRFMGPFEDRPDVIVSVIVYGLRVSVAQQIIYAYEPWLEVQLEISEPGSLAGVQWVPVRLRGSD
jgi:hypothetical protein